jgi:hypothetical protein
MQALCVRDTNAAEIPPPNDATQAVVPSPAEKQNPGQDAQSPAYWTDPSTGLTWTVKDNGKDVNLGEALMYCHDLRLARYSDWRLPTIGELERIHFSNTESSGPASKEDDRPITDRVTGNLLLTGDPWSSSPVDEESEWPSDFVWYLNVESGTRVFDDPSYDHARRALCVHGSKAQQALPANALRSEAISSSGAEGSAQETQLRGYWIDPSTGLMWTAKDSLQRSTWWDATKSCHELRLARYSDWRLPTVDELQAIYDESAEAPGENPRTHWREPEPRVFHVKGNLFLTGDQLSSTHEDGESGSVPKYLWGFDFKSGNRFKDNPDRRMNMRMLCVRRSGE